MRTFLDLFQKVFNHATWSVWHPKVIGGDTATVLDDKVKQISDEIKSKREEAQAKWSAFDQLRTELSQSDEDVSNPESEGFKKAEEAHREYATLADELAALESRRERLWGMTSERGVTEPGSPEREARERVKDELGSESYALRVVGSEEYKQLRESGMLNSRSKLGNVQLGQMMTREEFHAVVVSDPDGTSTTAPLIDPQRRGLIEPRFRPLLITDLITVGQTDSDSIEYVLETGWTNNAGTVPEAQSEAAIGSGSPAVTNVTGGVKPQSSLSYEKETESVKTLAHWVPITRKTLADVARIRSIIEGRLSRGLLDVLEDQIVAGDGQDENLTGILTTEGIQHQERTAAEPLVNDIHRAITKLRLAFFEPTAVGLHPLDWEGIRLSREDDTNGTGQYIYGPPSQAGPAVVWGQPVVSGPQFVEEQPIVADWRTVELYIREGVQVLASDSHADFFVRNLVALLAEMRAGLIVPQPEAICEVSVATS